MGWGLTWWVGTGLLGWTARAIESGEPVWSLSLPEPRTLVVPTNMLTQDSTFGSGTLRGPCRVQLVYGAALFPPEPMAIVELRFRPDRQYGSAFSTTASNLVIWCSTTTRAPDDLSRTFDENVGEDATEVFNGTAALSSAFVGPPEGPKVFDIVIPLGRPFVYDPAAGNLLIDIRNYGAPGASLLSGQARPDDLASRVVGAVSASLGSPDTGAEAVQLVYYPTNVPPSPPPRLTRGPYLQKGTPTNMLVCWRTSRAADSRVQFGLQPDALEWTVTDDALVTDHVIALTNLTPNTRYYYAVGTREGILAGGPDYTFVTAPTNAKPTRIWVLGDSGTAGQPGYEGLAAAVRDAYYAYTGDRETDVWLMLGDDAYLSGTDAEFQIALFDVYPTMLRRTPLWSCIGNHDVNPVGWPYLQIFHFPTNGEAGGVPSGSEKYYSFDYGNIHFVCLDSESSDRTPTGPMWRWLEQDLAANTKDWLIAFWHSPPYSKGTHDSDSWDLSGQMLQMRQYFVPLLEDYGVDLVLGGHSHDYQRSYLLDGHYGYSTELLPSMIKDSGSGRPGDTGAYRKSGLGPQPHQGAVYVVAGSSGWVTQFIPGLQQHPAMYITNRTLGSLVIDIYSNRLDAVFLRETGAIDDCFTILKGVSPEPLRLATFRLGPSRIQLQWKSIAGRSYQVQWASGLDSSDWLPLSPVITATSATTGWTNSSLPSVSQAFFRVVQVQ